MTQPDPQMLDLDRDAVALVAAVLDRDEEGLRVITASTDLPRLAVLLAGTVIGVMQQAGLDPHELLRESRQRLLNP